MTGLLIVARLYICNITLNGVHNIATVLWTVPYPLIKYATLKKCKNLYVTYVLNVVKLFVINSE